MYMLAGLCCLSLYITASLDHRRRDPSGAFKTRSGTAAGRPNLRGPNRTWTAGDGLVQLCAKPRLQSHVRVVRGERPGNKGPFPIPVCTAGADGAAAGGSRYEQSSPPATDAAPAEAGTGGSGSEGPMGPWPTPAAIGPQNGSQRPTRGALLPPCCSSSAAA